MDFCAGCPQGSLARNMTALSGTHSRTAGGSSDRTYSWRKGRLEAWFISFRVNLNQIRQTAPQEECPGVTLPELAVYIKPGLCFPC